MKPGHIKFGYWRRSSITAGALMLMSALSLAQTASFDTPLPLATPRPIKRGPSEPQRDATYLILNLRQRDSLVLAQVTDVSMSEPPRGARTDYYSVDSFRIQVLQTINGPVKSGGFEIVYRPSGSPVNHFTNGRSPILATARRGELWLVNYDNRHSAFDLSNCMWLTGFNDPVLLQLRRSVDWLKRKDEANVMHEIVSIAAATQSRPIEDRMAALYTLHAFKFRQAKSEQEAKERSSEYKQAVVQMLSNRRLPLQLKSKLLQMTSVDITHNLESGSNDSLQMLALLNVVENNKNTELVDVAANALYFVLIQQPRIKPNTVYFCPEIIEALDLRAERDRADNKPSGVNRTLNNLALIGRRNLGDIQRSPGVNVEIRHVPAMPDSDIAKRIVRATFD